ncbi:hypothetical protein DFQ28_010971 [Apophysomyces sp. BC1034]|nr:hypothetical protein DFQ28_010971 [Apophysomyces sp. BC1034]
MADTVASTRSAAPHADSRPSASAPYPRRMELPPSLQNAPAAAHSRAKPRPASALPDPAPLTRSRPPTRVELTAAKQLIQSTPWARDQLSAYGMAKGLQPLEKFIDPNGHAIRSGKMIKRLDNLERLVKHPPLGVELLAGLLSVAMVNIPLILYCSFEEKINRWKKKRPENVYEGLERANRAETLDQIGFVPPPFAAAMGDRVIDSGPPLYRSDEHTGQSNAAA